MSSSKGFLPLGLLTCEEHLELIRPFVTTLQAQSQALSDTGYTVVFRGEEYDFIPTFKHRWAWEK